MDNTKILGVGRLSWTRCARVTDRYGAVGLFDAAMTDDSMPLDMHGMEGKRGTLRAVVLETRPSGHIGDLCHGVGPGGATVGDIVTLGQGTLFVEENYGPRVGLLPDDGREYQWLDVAGLYQCHRQTVRLEFMPE